MVNLASISLFKADFYENNRRALAKKSGLDTIVVAANGLLQRNADNTFPFRQDSNFWYLCGIEIADSILVLKNDKSFLLLPAQSPNEIVFGTPYNLKQIKQASGVDEVLVGRVADKWFKQNLGSVKEIGVLKPSPNYVPHYGMFVNPGRRRAINKIRRQNNKVNLVDIRADLASLRMVKQPEEIRAIQKAINITNEAIDNVVKRLKKYQYEYEIHADLIRDFRVLGASGEAFGSIVASGANTCHLHYQQNNSRLGDMLYLDVGAEYANYAADITRTIFVGRPSRRQKQVYDAVKRVQDFAITLVKPGPTIRENERLVESKMGEELIKLGLIKENKPAQVRKYFTHGTSHYLGLDVHDTGDYDAPMEPGMVLTVEPGIYILEEKIGVRIEDDVLVTEKGCRVLSDKLK